MSYSCAASCNEPTSKSLSQARLFPSKLSYALPDQRQNSNQRAGLLERTLGTAGRYRQPWLQFCQIQGNDLEVLSKSCSRTTSCTAKRSCDNPQSKPCHWSGPSRAVHLSRDLEVLDLVLSRRLVRRLTKAGPGRQQIRAAAWLKTEQLGLSATQPQPCWFLSLSSKQSYIQLLLPLPIIILSFPSLFLKVPCHLSIIPVYLLPSCGLDPHPTPPFLVFFQIFHYLLPLKSILPLFFYSPLPCCLMSPTSLKWNRFLPGF